MNRVLVTGGCGFKGSVLVPLLLKNNYYVKVLDTMWFGNYLNPHPNLEIINKDIRNVEITDLENVSKVIHLANIANDPSVELQPLLSWEVNVLATYKLLDLAARSSVSQFIFASSGSVYGIKSEEHVTEELELLPLSAYNKTKMIAERVCLSFSRDFYIHCIRPATVCGVSPRMRLDVAVNLLTFQALSENQITVLGGSQIRPNIHINDIARLYLFLMNNKLAIPSGCYNAGFENISIMDIANKIKSKTGCKILVKDSNDPRSYRQDSSLIKSYGFSPVENVDSAIEQIIEAFEKGKLTNKPQWSTVNWMKLNNFK